MRSSTPPATSTSSTPRSSRGAGGVPAPLEDAPAAAEPAAAEANGADSEDARARSYRRWREVVAEAATASRSMPPATPKPRFPATSPGGPRERRQALPRRAISFLRASWAELQRVQWPNRTQVTQATAVVLGFVAIAGAYLGAADWLAQKIVNLIL